MQRAADQTACANTTVEALLATAGDEADAIRAAGHADARAHLSRTRRRVQTVLGRLADRLRGEVQEADRRATELGEAAAAVVASAEEDAARRREQAEADARLALEEAEAGAAQILERADRRTAESEAGAQRLRGLVADEVVGMRTKASDELRRSREEAARVLSEAQADAEQSRTQARELLASARAEVSALKQRRDEIAAELSQLSGVIEALAVSESESEEQP
jgi:hypothetical protein